MATNLLGEAFVRISARMDLAGATGPIQRALAPVGDAVDRVTQRFRDTERAAGDAADEVDEIGDAARRAADDVDRIGDAADEAARDATTIQEELDEAEREAQQAADEVESIRQELEQAERAAQQAADEVGETGDEARRAAGQVDEIRQRLEQGEAAARQATSRVEELRRELDKAGDAAGDVGDGLDEAAGSAEGAGDTAGRGMSGGILGGMAGLAAGLAGLFAAAAAAAGAVFVAGFGEAVEAEASGDRLAAQLGLSGDEAAEVAKVQSKVYSAAWGESLDEVGEAVRGVTLNIGDLGKDAEGGLEGLTTKALALAEVFGVDVSEATAAVGQLLRTGLADSADEAFDIVTRGFQLGVDKSGDFLDTLGEYSTQWRKFGLDAETATGLLSQGLNAGARDADIVADAIKEFSIRAVDGSAEAAASFEALGLNADEMRAIFAKGGPEAAAALDLVLDKLRGTEGQANAAEIAFGLFGTQSEDLGAALYALDPSSAVAALGEVEGAANKAAETVGGNAKSAFESFKRTLMTELGHAADVVVPPLTNLATAATSKIGPAFSKLGEIISTKVVPFLRDDLAPVVDSYVMPALRGLGDLFTNTLVPAAEGAARVWQAQLRPAFDRVVGAIRDNWPQLQQLGNVLKVIGEIVIKVVAGAIGILLVNALQTGSRAIAAIIQVIGLLVSIVGGLWSACVTAFNAIVTAGGAVGRWFAGLPAMITGALSTIGSTVSAPFVTAWNWVWQKGEEAAGWFVALPGRVTGALSTIGSTVSQPFIDGWNWVSTKTEEAVGWFVALPGRAQGALATIGSVVSQPFIDGFTWVSGKVEEGVGWFVALPGRVGGALSSIASTVSAPFKDGWDNYVKPAIDTAVGWFTGIPGKITTALSGAGSAISSPFKTGFNAVASAWNNTIGKISFSIPGWVPGLGGKGWSFPKIPLMAKGGIVTAAGWTMVGERGPELLWQGRGAAVSPLPDHLDLSRDLGTPGRSLVLAPRTTYTVDARGATDPAALEAAMERVVARSEADLLRTLTAMLGQGVGAR